jgi:hypothetical protein
VAKTMLNVAHRPQQANGQGARRELLYAIDAPQRVVRDAQVAQAAERPQPHQADDVVAIKSEVREVAVGGEARVRAGKGAQAVAAEVGGAQVRGPRLGDVEQLGQAVVCMGVEGTW